MDPVLFVQLAVPPIIPLDRFAEQTDLLSDSHRFRTHIVLAFCDPSMRKAPSVAGVFNEVAPRDGAWTLEVAVELTDLLPAIDGKSEAILAVSDGKGGQKQLCLSNRMSRFHYQDGQMAYQVLTPRTDAWHGAAEIEDENGTVLRAAEEQLRTVASMRFVVTGKDAEHAFESSIKGCCETLFNSVNTALGALRECKSGFAPVTRSIQWDGVPVVYVLMSGSGKPKGAQLALNLSRVALIPDVVDGEPATRCRAIIDGSTTLSDVDRLIGEARSSWQDGEYEFAFLQAVIAAEIATMRAIRAQCERRGVSRTKLKELRKEMTYSLALNVHLPLALPDKVRPPRKLVDAMNEARSKRNDLMHEAVFNMGRNEIGQLLNDTRDFVRALEAAALALSEVESVPDHQNDSQNTASSQS